MVNSVVNLTLAVSMAVFMSAMVIANPFQGNVPRQLLELSGSCPKDSSGIFPNCNCNGGKTYDADNSICLDLDRTKCPKRSVGEPPHCKCEDGYQLDDIHWYCRPWYLNVTHADELKCEQDKIWNGTHCAKIPCPKYLNYQEERFYPNCTYYAPPAPPTHYPLTTPPNEVICPGCGSICPAYHYWNRKTEKCEPIKCPDGYVGDFQPNCSFKPKCPAEFPGEWPYCNIYDAGPRLDERPTHLKELPHHHHHH